MKKECIAMILAGGQGTRLKPLTENLAKPAVYYGGKYRIIDFTLSNCVHSGIETVGVLTQYEPLILNSYIGIGASWDMDRKNGGISILPPRMHNNGGVWYKGTANSVYQNLDYIEYYNPEYVLILSGDHIYKMDYSKMLDYHKEMKAELTISVKEVSWDDASRYGIMNTYKDGTIYEFDEKPESPKSNLASMGIYIFNWSSLKKYLTEDEKNPESNNDFGKDIIPAMLRDNRSIYAYPFKGYWKDVGTIKSLWEANMDLLNKHNMLNLSDPNWKIYSVNPIRPPHFISSDSKTQNSLIGEGCQVYGEVINSVLFPGVNILKGAKIHDSVVMPMATIKENTSVNRAIIGSEAVISQGSKIGDSNSEDITLIDDHALINQNTIYCVDK